MANNFFRIKKGTNLDPQAGTSVTVEGDVAYRDDVKKLEVHDGTTADNIVQEAKAATLSNKTLDNTTVATIKDVNFTIQDDSDTSKQIRFDASNLTTGITRTYTFPDINNTLAGTTATQSLTNKTLSTSNTIELLDSNFTLRDDGDSSKQLKFQTSGISTLTTRTLTAPDANTTIVGTDATQTLTNKTVSKATNTFSGFTAHNVITADSSGFLSDGVAPGSAGNVLTSDGTDWISSTPSTAPDQSYELSNLSISASVSSNALTIALKTKAGSDPSGGSPVKIGFRSSTATTGTYNQRSVTSALSVVVSNGSTLGIRSGVSNYVFVYAIDNAGTVELGVSNSWKFSDGSLYSSTAEGGAGAADNAGTLYTTTARTSVPVRLIGRVKITHSSGAWSSSPTEVSIQPLEIINPPTARASLNSGSVSSNTITLVQFDNVSFDPMGLITTGSGWVFTAPVPGYYRVNAKVVFDASGNWVAGNSCQLFIYVNGVDMLHGLRQWIETTTSTRDLGATVEGIVQMSANDYIEIKVRQISGGSRSYVPGNEDNHFSVDKVADL